MARPRLPKALLQARGSWLAKKRPDDFQPPAGVPDQEYALEGAALELWDRLAPMLQEQGILSTIDGLALTSLCLTWGRLCQAQEAIDHHGLTCVVDGVEKARPEVAIVEKAQALLQLQMEKFGLLPAARTKIVAAKPRGGTADLSKYFAPELP